MAYQQERDYFIDRMTREGLPVDVTIALLREATGLNRRAELACSSEAADRDRVRCPRSTSAQAPCLCDGAGHDGSEYRARARVRGVRRESPDGGEPMTETPVRVRVRAVRHRTARGTDTGVVILNGTEGTIAAMTVAGQRSTPAVLTVWWDVAIVQDTQNNTPTAFMPGWEEMDVPIGDVVYVSHGPEDLSGRG